MQPGIDRSIPRWWRLPGRGWRPPRVPRARPGATPGLSALVALAAALATGCATPSAGTRAAAPPVISGTSWRADRPVGYHGDGVRRNLGPGDTLRFRGLTAISLGADPGLGAPDTVRLVLMANGASSERALAEGAAVRWSGYRVAVLAVRADAGELGAGQVEIEAAPVEGLPAALATSDHAGGADMRIRIPHRITHLTLHHSGSPEPLRPEDDPVEKLRGLQAWGRTDRNWWDVPYHFLIDLQGRIYEGRDWRYMGETNTGYDPRGHLLISVLGNYELQEPTPAQIDAITALMAWAAARFGVPPDRIGGHYDHASTSCPGAHLRRYLEDGTFHRAVRARQPGSGAAADVPAWHP